MASVEEKNFDFYAGSRVLWPISSAIGLPLDQVNFIFCQLVSLVLAYVYRKIVSTQKTTTTTRHLIEIGVGIGLMLFCFGIQIWHYIAQSVICLVIIKTLPPGQMERVNLVAVLGYLCLCHIYRLIYDYGGYTLDITGPLMINTQRLTCLAFSLKDGTVPDEQLSKPLRAQSVKKSPSLLEFFSYTLSFHGVMCGPLTFYKDYIEFIEGKYKRTVVVKVEGSQTDTETVEKIIDARDLPSPSGEVMYKIGLSMICAVGVMFMIPMYNAEYMLSKEFSGRNFFGKLWYILLSTSFMRCQYYFAWKLSEAANNNAGLGFKELDETTKTAKWDLISNANIWEVENSQSLKVLLDNWNITTAYWLRHVVYERVPFAKTLLVFTCSAFWHGFYPGYYTTFFTGAAAIQAARLVRRRIRPFFKSGSSTTLPFIYDTITYIASRISLAYIVSAFMLLELSKGWQLYTEIYFFLHIITALLLIGLNLWPKSKSRSDRKDKSGSKESEKTVGKSESNQSQDSLPEEGKKSH